MVGQKGESQIQKREIKQHAAPVIFLLLVKPCGFLRVVQKVEDLPVHLARDVKIAVGEGAQRDQGAQFVVVPILDKRDSDFVGFGKDLSCRAFIIK